MDGTVGDENLDPPSRLFERLRQIAGYSWDEGRAFHSSYDNWYYNLSPIICLCY
jgi:hypothetical protein